MPTYKLFFAALVVVALTLFSGAAVVGFLIHQDLSHIPVMVSP